MIKRFFKRMISTSEDYFSIDIEQEKLFLNSLKEPMNDFERSFNQYQCQKFVNKNRSYVIFNIISFWVLVPFIIICYCRPKPRKVAGVKCDAVFLLFNKRARDWLPKELLSKFESIFYDDISINKFKLLLKDVNIIIGLIIRYPCNFYFLLKVISKIAEFRYIIQQYNPSEIIATLEYSCTSSIITLFCNNNNIELISFLHGEKIFHIRDSFFRFNQFYIWDEHYIKLYHKLRAGKNKFIIYQPISLRVDIDKYRQPSRLCDYTYYVQMVNETELLQIIENIKHLVSCGYQVKIRSHPRIDCSPLLKKHLKNEYIEDFRQIGIEESLANTKNVISIFSTVLYQAYMNGISVVLDDIVFKDYVSQLESRDYILCSKPHLLLSEVIQEKVS
jgi:hypothetical protein